MFMLILMLVLEIGIEGDVDVVVRVSFCSR